MSLTRREFLEGSVGMGALGPTIFQRPQPSASEDGERTGKKGQVYPDQRQKVRDPKSGHTVWQLTNLMPARSAHMFYPTNRSATPDSRWQFYSSDRGGPKGRNDLFKMDLRTGESIQLTDTGDIDFTTPDIAYSGKEIFFFNRSNVFRAINVETLQEREIGRLEPDDPSIHFNMPVSVSPDDRSVVIGFQREKGRKYVGDGHFAPWLIKSSLTVLSTVDGKQRDVFIGLVPLDHVKWNPTDPNLIFYINKGPGSSVQRPWLIHADGTGNRPIFVCVNGEQTIHEVFSDNGRTLYANIVGGRQPQGMWATNVDGTNERCVLAGSAIGHVTVNAEEDRFVTDDRLGDGSSLWMAGKGSREAKLLCQMRVSWTETRSDGTVHTTGFHPDGRFLPNGQGVSFISGGDLFHVEI
jgi:Oligogalacturonate lyase